METDHCLVTPVALPSESGIATVYQSMDLADAYAVELPADASTNPELLARFIFSRQAPWVSGLTTIRDALVAVFGLKTSTHLASLGADDKANRVGIFKICGRSKTEIVLGEDDRHLDFRLSVLCSATSTGNRRLTLSTVVHCHNRLGRAYIFLIAPFHRLVVQSALRRAGRAGWPRAAGR